MVILISLIILNILSSLQVKKMKPMFRKTPFVVIHFFPLSHYTLRKISFLTAVFMPNPVLLQNLPNLSSSFDGNFMGSGIS